MHCAKCFFYESAVGDDTCNRCGRAYLPEANVYLGLLLLVTGGMAFTLRHLLTGEADLGVRPALDLGGWATWPVSMVDRPAYGLVIGGWLAVLAAVPILVGILYGKRGGWLLVIATAVLGPSLGLAAATAVGVWIAAGQHTRLESKMSSALLGLVPPAIYWFVAAARSEVEALPPAIHSLVYVPPIAAVAVAAAISIPVVAIGWADRWHVRWPGAMLTVLAAGPVLALLAFVGMDEVRYGLLVRPRPVPQSWLASGPADTMEGLQAFLARYPASPRAAEIRARLAMRLEQKERTASAEATAARAQDVWQDLVQRHPDSPWAVDARLHLGDAAARQGLFDQAEQFFSAALARTIPAESSPPDPSASLTSPWDLFSIGPALKAKEEADHLKTLRRDLLLRLGLLLENCRGTPDDKHSLALYFAALDLKGTNRYRERLLAAGDAARDGPLADNVAYDLARFEANNVKRIHLLQQVAETWPGTDGAMLARLAAASALMDRAVTESGAMREAQQQLLRVQADLGRRIARRPDDPYAAALADEVEKELVYVQAQLRAPQERP